MDQLTYQPLRRSPGRLSGPGDGFPGLEGGPELFLAGQPQLVLPDVAPEPLVADLLPAVRSFRPQDAAVGELLDVTVVVARLAAGADLPGPVVYLAEATEVIEGRLWHWPAGPASPKARRRRRCQGRLTGRPSGP